LKHHSTRLLLLQQINSKLPALVAVFVDPPESGGIGRDAHPHHLFRLFYQVEIRRLPIPSSKIRSPLTAADTRDSKTRLWQLRGCLYRNAWICRQRSGRYGDRALR
jgi:hypothetical protein